MADLDNVQDLGNVAGTKTLDFSAGRYIKATLTANTTFAVKNAKPGAPWFLELMQGPGGPFTILWNGAGGQAVLGQTTDLLAPIVRTLFTMVGRKSDPIPPTQAVLDSVMMLPRIDLSALESTAAGLGASLVGVQDAAGTIGQPNVEAALAQINALPWYPAPVVAVATTELAGTRVGDVLTSNAPGALPAIDTQTLTAGQRVLLVMQATSGHFDDGVYVVTNAGAVGVHWVLTRAPENKAGSPMRQASYVVATGHEWANSDWRATAGDQGANWCAADPFIFPASIARTVTLVGGKFIFGAGAGGDGSDFFFVAAFSTVSITRNTAAGAGIGNTVQYGAPSASRVDGRPGTASLLVQAEVAAGTINVGDTSTVDVFITMYGPGTG